MLKRLLFAFVVGACALPPAARAQTDCNPPVIVANARKSGNIFTPEQETVFGELMVESVAGEWRFLRDEALLAYAREIGDRLVKHLPPTGLQFRFHLIDIPEANAFNIPGGHVFLSRKLVAFVRDEDELAGVIAHELGHAAVHHGALDVSQALKRVLNVTSLGDRKDVIEKYNLLIERARTKSVPQRRGHEDEQQLEADRIGLFAMVAAGYDPASFSSFFDRLTESGGKTGGWLSDIFGTLKPEQKRLREMIRATQQLPPACRAGRAGRATEGFLKWQAEVVSFREAGRKEELPGLVWKRDLAPKLRSDISHVAFSRDGKYLLAQDDFAVTVISREPLRVLFQIPVEGARAAAFTPDGRQVVFTTRNLRFERWGVEERRPLEVRELVLRGDCWEHGLSPDGNYLACVDTATNVNVLDVRTGKRVWEKKQFYPLSSFEYFMWLLASAGGDGDEGGVGFFRIGFSPDSRYVMFSRSEQYRFRFSLDGMTLAGSENTALALDLTTLKPADLGGDIKKLSARPYLFLEDGRVLGSPGGRAEDGGVFSFPAGKRLQRFTFGADEIKRTGHPDYVVVTPRGRTQIGFFDLKRGVVASGLRKADADMWSNLTAYEGTSGKLLLREVAYNEAEKRFDQKEAGSVEIPVSSLSGLESAAVSEGLGWLLISSKTRGGLWSLETGERRLYVRGFRGGVVAADGAGVGDFPPLDDAPHSLVLMNPHDKSAVPVRELPERGARQYGRFVLLRSKLKRDEKKQDEKKEEKEEKKGEKGEKSGAPPPPADSEAEEATLRRDVRFELKDFVKDKVVWTRDFRGAAPEFTFDDASGRLIFYWRLGSDAGKARLRESAELKAKADALGNKADDYLVEVVDAFAQKTVGALPVETGQGSFNVGRGFSEGDWLVVRDSEHRLLVYSLKDGELRHRFYGSVAAVSPKGDLLAVENFDGEVGLYDLATGDRRARLLINGGAAFLRFDLGGTRLFVLSDAQTAYAFDLAKLPAKSAAD